MSMMRMVTNAHNKMLLKLSVLRVLFGEMNHSFKNVKLISTAHFQFVAPWFPFPTTRLADSAPSSDERAPGGLTIYPTACKPAFLQPLLSFRVGALFIYLQVFRNAA